MAVVPFEVENEMNRENLLIPPSKICEKLHPSSSSICFTCCCPCLLLGEMRSSIERDSSLCFGKIGKVGCQECLLTIPMCLLCWPFSPLLSCYLYQQENHLHAIYNQNAQRHKSCKDFCYQLCCWPLSLYQNRRYVHQKKEEGLLHYKWAYEIPPEQNRRPNSLSNDLAVLIIGPPQSGKTELLMKLTGRRISNYAESSFSAEEIRIGLKETFLSNDELQVIEFWDIPVSKLESIPLITSRVKFVLLLYDCHSRDSFKKMKDLFSEIYCLPSLASASYLCIATKDDYQFTRAAQRGLPPREEAEEEEEGDGDEGLGRFLRLKRQEEDLGPCHTELKAGRTWAKERGFRYVPISSRYNSGVTSVLRALRSPGR
jgi:hypothetical protein